MFAESGEQTAVTAIEAGPCVVTQVKTTAADGYAAVQLGFGQAKKLISPLRGHLKEAGLLKHLREFRLPADTEVKVGDSYGADLFKAGDLVDVIGISKGKGFAGTVKRYHFAGGPKTHGQSDRHRAPGSIGASAYPARVFKGMRMAGRMGNSRVTVRKLKVYAIDGEKNLLLIKGGGSRG